MFDSTNSEFMRLCNDTTFFDKAVNAQIIKPYRKAGVKKSDTLRTRQRDKMFYANVKAPFTMAISAKIRTVKRGPTRCPALAPKRICVFKGKGLLIGTTYSGHPTCTTLMGTSRNMNIHLFGIWRRRNTFSFGVRLASLPTKNFIDDDGAIYAMPRLKDVLEIVRIWILMMFAGDDTGIAFKVEADSVALEAAMREICARANVVQVHGLGYVLKSPKRDFKRISILSRHLASYRGIPIVLRKLDKLILTSTARSPSLTPDENHMLAAMSLYSYSLDPLSKALINMRVSMINDVADPSRAVKEFYKDRM